MINFQQINPINPKKLEKNHQNHKIIDLKQKNFVPCDVISFSGNSSLLKKYGIEPSKVKVVSKNCDTSLSIEDKTELLTKVVEAHEHALKNQKLGNFSGRQISSNIKLSNGKWDLSTNIENNADSTIFCAERSAMVKAWNKGLEFLNLKDLQTKPKIKKAQQGLSVECLVMSTSKPPGKESIDPCADCLEWMNENRYFKANTKVITIEPDQKTKEPILKIKTVSELLPQRNEKTSIANTDFLK